MIHQQLMQEGSTTRTSSMYFLVCWVQAQNKKTTAALWRVVVIGKENYILIISLWIWALSFLDSGSKYTKASASPRVTKTSLKFCRLLPGEQTMGLTGEINKVHVKPNGLKDKIQV